MTFDFDSLLSPPATNSDDGGFDFDSIVTPQQSAATGSGGFIPEPVARLGLKTLRVANELLEPLQLPQDALFATLRGLKDPTTSVTEQVKGIFDQAGAYFDPTQLAPRPNTGKDILQLYGVENSITQNVGGFALDLFADPLLAGAAISGVGKGIKAVSGASDLGDSVIKTGRKVEEAISPVGAYKGTTAAIEGITGVQVRNGIESGATELAKAVFNLPLGRQDGAIKRTLGDAILPRRRSLQLQLGQKVGADVSRLEGLAKQKGADINEVALAAVEDINTLLGKNHAEKWWKKSLGDVAKQSTALDEVRALPSSLQDVILDTSYNYVQKRGILGTNLESLEKANSPLLKEFARDIKPVNDSFRADSSFKKGLMKDYGAALRSVKQKAIKLGHSPQLAEDRFRKVTQILQETNALLGYNTSFYRPIKDNFLEALTPVLGQQAVPAWNEVLRKGIGEGKDINSLTSIVGREISELVPGAKNVGDILADVPIFKNLDINAYVKSLANGHLRRAFAAFTDDSSFTRYTKALEEGRLIPSNVVNDASLSAYGTKNPEAAASLQKYFSTLSPQVGRGLTISRNSLLNHLSQDLKLSPKKAGEVLNDFHKQVVASPKYAAFMDKVSSNLSKYGLSPNASGGGTASTSPFQARTDFTQVAIDSLSPAAIKEIALKNGANVQGLRTEQLKRFVKPEDVAESVRKELEVLGEMANPIVSLGQTADVARRIVPIQDMVTGLYKIAKQNNLVSTSRGVVKNGSVTKLPDHASLGPFAGQYVNEFIKKELYRGLRHAPQRSGILNRLGNLASGAKLASPRSIFANVPGGVFTTSLLGVNPIEMTRQMARTLKDFAKASRDPSYSFDDLDELRSVVPLEISQLSDAHIIRDQIKELTLEESGLGSGVLRRNVDKLIGTLEGFIQRPLGPLPVGLQAFQFTESWMKVSAYRAAKASAYTGSEAAEIARLSTFDYGEIPDLLRGLRDSKLILFPGFPYFLTGRIMEGLARRPGGIAVADRLPDAVSNALLSEEERGQFLAGIQNTWMEDEQMMPVRTRKGADGATVVSAIPMNQVLPTNPLGVTALGESLATLGLYTPLIEVANAVISGTGEAPLTKRFGNQVFEQGVSTPEKTSQIAAFLFKNFAPSIVNSAVKFGPDGATGLLPKISEALLESAVPQSEGLARSVYSYNEIRRRKPDKDLVDEIIGSTTRSTQPIALSGGLANVQKNLEVARRELNQEIAIQKRKAERALSTVSDPEVAAEIQNKYVMIIQEKQAKFQERWQPVLEELSGGQR